MASTTLNLLFLITCVSLLPLQVSAFGAGDIPDFSYLQNKAFRHGDIENILTEVAKTAGGLAAGGGILQLAQSVVGGAPKFDKADIKKVYFGNWLRDYSQAMDIGGLSKLSRDTLILVVAVLGFMSFGVASDEFEVTPERLGVYLPVEHIDNPKGYAAEVGGDARRFHPNLRPPVNSQELEIDPRTGMKNYMATENRGWDTSTAHIRRTLQRCIGHGRRSGGSAGPDLCEAYRLLGTALHTLEDLLAHSNWCEVGLKKMGHQQVFCHVGDRVIINTPNGPAPPLVTGTFGSADFLHSLMGEATDKLSQASVTDLSKKMDDASNADQSSVFSTLKTILDKIPLGGGSSQMSQGETLAAESKAYHFDPNNVAPPEVQRRLWALLKWHDNVFRNVSEITSSIPGLESLLSNLSDALNTYVYTILAPWLTPVLKQITSTLGDASKVVIDSSDQYEVFSNPHASDPTHSLLSKDHFALILNEPAGKVAQVVVQYTVKLVVQAWFDNRVNPDETISRVLEAFHHPYFNVGRSGIQDEMFRALGRWVNDLEDREQVIGALSEESVKCGRNKRQGSSEEGPGAQTGTHSESTHRPSTYEQPSGYVGRANLPSQDEEYKGQASGYQQGSMYAETSYREDTYPQTQTDYGRSQRDDRQHRPRHAGATYVEDHRASQDSYSPGERRGYEDQRQTSFSRHDTYERPPERSEYGGRSSYGRGETEEQHRPYEQQRHADRSEGRQQYSQRHEEHQQGYGEYPRPGDDHRHSGERQEYDGDRGSYRGGHEHERDRERQEYDGGRDSYRGGYEHGQDRERQEGYRGGEYESSGGGYEGTSHRRRDEGSEGERYGQRSTAYARHEGTENTPGTERYNLHGRDDDYSGRRGYEGSSPQQQYEGSNVERYGGRVGAYGRREDSEDSFGFERLNVQGRDEDHSEGRRQQGHMHTQGYGYPETEY